MKKLMKKSGSLLLALCMTVSCFTFSVYAAQGELQFSDPKGEAGDEIEVRMRVISNSGAIGSFEVKCSYDASLLRFESGTGATASNGTLTVSSVTDGSQTNVLQTIKFTALDEGRSKIEVIECKATLTSGEELVLKQGNSTVTVQGGTPVRVEEPPEEGPTVDVGGVTYTVDSEFKEKDIPMGFIAAETELYGTPVRAMVLENGDKYMFYLKNAEGESDYFLYDGEKGSFALTEPVLVNDELTIFLMDHTPEFELPERFWKITTMTINGKEFGVWNNMDDQDYYLVYAMNSAGSYGYYQYDKVEKTYQRMNMAELKAEDEEPEKEQPADSNLVMFFRKNMKPVLITAAALVALLLIIIIILARRLSIKADYEQYERNYYDNPEEKPKKKKKKRRADDGYGEEDYLPEPEEYEEDDGYDGQDDGFDEEDVDFDGQEDIDFDGQEDGSDIDGYDGEDYEDDSYDVDFYDEADDGSDYGRKDGPGGKTPGRPDARNNKGRDDFPIDFIEL